MISHEWEAFIARLDNSQLGKQSPITKVCQQFEQVFVPKEPDEKEEDVCEK